MMKCMIVQNEGIYLLLSICVAAISCSFVAESSQTIQALCSSNRYIYSLQPGDSHQLKLTSVNSPGEINKWYQKSKRKCRKEFKTNNGASHFTIKVSNMSIPSCSEKCHCNFFEITEPGHTAKFCGQNVDDIYFESKTDYLSIEFQHGLSMLFDVTFTFKVLRNTYVIEGVPKEGHTTGHFIETPFFPTLYQSDYVAEYIFQSESGHVMLMFLDFQLAPESFIEVVGHNNTHPERFFGDVFRPPVLVSETNQLNLKFEANNQLAAGFRAACFFLSDPDVLASKPFTNCGGAKDGYSGFLTIESSEKHNYYDCLWLISTPVFPHVKSYFLSVSKITLEKIGPKATLEFREGLNSKSKLVKSIICINFNCSTIPAEVTIPASNGLYIRFNGLLNPDSVINMTYSTYHNGNCSEKDIMCDEKCLFPALHCDGIKNCPDGSDEQQCTVGTSIVKTTPHPLVIKRESRSSTTEASFLVVLSFGICGLIVVLLVIILALYRRYKMGPSPSEEDVLPQIASEMSAGPLPGMCSRTSTYYDQPPSYDDFIRTSEQYPPLLYIRTANRSSENYNAYYNIQHTTSFCRKDIRHPSVHSIDLRSLNSAYVETHIPDEIPLFSEPGCSFGRSNNDRSFQESFFENSPGGLKKTASLDSILEKSSDKNCHFHLSITHSICSHACCHPDKFYSLPTQFKINELKPNEIDITFLTALPHTQCSKERKFSSCIVCCDSNFKSEVMTTVKTRCFSDPCKSVNLYYSLSH